MSMVDMGSLWTAPIRIEGPGASYYRPLALSVMAVLGWIGLPAIHLGTLLLHAGSAGLLVRILAGMGCRGAGVWMGALVFAVHPLVSEVLGWASAMPDALAVTLGLAAVAAGGGWRLTLWVVAAALCKETALLIPAAFGLAGGLRSGWWRAWGLAVAGWLLIRMGVGVATPDLGLDKLDLVPLAMGWSIGSVAWPFPLSAVRDLLAPPTVVPWLGLALVLVLALSSRRDKPAWAGLGLLVMAPALALPTVLDGYLVGERYLYPGLVGLAIWLAARVTWSPPRWVGPVVVGAALLVHGFRAVDWRDDMSLFGAAGLANVESSYAWHFLGVTHGKAGRWRDAAFCLKQAIATGHPHPEDTFLRLQALVRAVDGVDLRGVRPHR
jgi:hypothetical protein